MKFIPQIGFIFEKKYTFLIDVLMNSMETCNNIFNIETKFSLSFRARYR